MSEPFRLVVDRTSIVIITLIGLVIAPGLMIAAALYLTHGFDPAATSVGEWIAAALVLGFAVLVGRVTARELAGALRVRIDEHGVARGSTRIGWDSVAEVGAPEFGYLYLRDAAGREVRITSYLLDNRAALLEHLGSKVGVKLREPSKSF